MQLARASTWYGAQEKQFYDSVFAESKVISIGSRAPLKARHHGRDLWSDGMASCHDAKAPSQLNGDKALSTKLKSITLMV